MRKTHLVKHEWHEPHEVAFQKHMNDVSFYADVRNESYLTYCGRIVHMFSTKNGTRVNECSSNAAHAVHDKLAFGLDSLRCKQCELVAKNASV